MIFISFLNNDSKVLTTLAGNITWFPNVTQQEVLPRGFRLGLITRYASSEHLAPLSFLPALVSRFRSARLGFDQFVEPLDGSSAARVSCGAGERVGWGGAVE